jgi:hypothetical protein
MPALSAKHEQFVQLIVRGTRYGWTQGEAYQRAGFRSVGHAAEVCASRLLKKADIQARLAELSAPAFKKAQVTVESLLAELEANIAGATAAQQHGAVNGSVQLMAKLRGLLTDRIEVGGAGAFSPASVDEVIESVGRELGPEAAMVITWTCGDPDEPMPYDELARTTLQGMTLDQALARTEELRLALLQLASDDAKIVEAVEGDPPRDTVDHEALALLTPPKRGTSRR